MAVLPPAWAPAAPRPRGIAAVRRAHRRPAAPGSPAALARLGGGAASAALGAAAARTAYRLLVSPRQAGRVEDVFHTRQRSRDVWARTNHRGAEVTLLEGPALAFGLCAGAALAPRTPRRLRAAAVMAAAGGAVFGAYDDLAGEPTARGFAGHLGALTRGRLTTGTVKVAGIGATGVAAAALSGRRRPGDLLLDGALIAATANLCNLLDLRPGRAAKAALAVAAPALAGPAPGLAGAVAGAAAALLPEDLAERAMLGDCGANALGAALGAAAAASLPRPARLAALGAVAGLTLAAEFVSFTEVIEATPALRRLDHLGRRPADPPGPVAATAPMPRPTPQPARRPTVPRQRGAREPHH